MLTTALVAVSATAALVIALPLGVLAATNNMVERALRPVLDFMQTMPPWVYLIPAVIFFSLGRTPAVFATAIFAIPPPLRLTNLGIRQVPSAPIEAGKAFGANKFQILTKIQLPMALPTIMAGVNQCIMMSLSMVVLAGLIGAGGLGGEVVRGLTRMMIGVGVRAGICIVILAIIFDRLTLGIVKLFQKGNVAGWLVDRQSSVTRIGAILCLSGLSLVGATQLFPATGMCFTAYISKRSCGLNRNKKLLP